MKLQEEIQKRCNEKILQGLIGIDSKYPKTQKSQVFKKKNYHTYKWQYQPRFWVGKKKCFGKSSWHQETSFFGFCWVSILGSPSFEGQRVHVFFGHAPPQLPQRLRAHRSFARLGRCFFKQTPRVYGGLDARLTTVGNDVSKLGSLPQEMVGA